MATTTIDAYSSSSTADYWEKTSSDTFAESITNARDIGQVRLNYSRLSLTTTISEQETQDWFSFTVTSSGDLRLTAINLTAQTQSDDEIETSEVLASLSGETDDTDSDSMLEMYEAEGLLIELYTYVNNRQVLLATNDSSNESGYEAFQQLMRGEYSVDAGTYYIHVATQDGQPASEDILYALQLQMGDTYSHDYLTQESAVDYVNTSAAEIATQEAMASMNYSSDYIDSKILAAQGAAEILSAGYTNMAQYVGVSSSIDSSYIFTLLV